MNLPHLPLAEVGASCLKIKYSNEPLKAGNDGFSSFLWSRATVKIIEHSTKTSYARASKPLWLGSWASTTTPTARRLAVDTFPHACLHGLCDFLALCRCFLQIFVSFIICFFENNFQYCNGITCFLFLMVLFYHKKLLSLPKIQKAEFILGRFISHL